MNCETCPIKEECDKNNLKLGDKCPLLFVITHYGKHLIDEARALYELKQFRKEFEDIGKEKGR